MASFVYGQQVTVQSGFYQGITGKLVSFDKVANTYEVELKTVSDTGTVSFKTVILTPEEIQ